MYRRLAIVVILAFFVPLTLLIDFAHTEKTPKPNPACPACQFQSSSITTQAVPCFVLPQISFVEIVEPAAVRVYRYLAAFGLPSRGPPQA